MLLRSQHASSYGVWTDPEHGVVKERDYLECVHCGVSWEVKPGSGNTRGFCMNCMQPTCGRLVCQSCVPFMKRIEMAERRARFFAALGLV